MWSHANTCAFLAHFIQTTALKKWRHHGIGVLQAYLRESVEPEIRVHVWHPALVRPGIRGSGDAHDHRFDLESAVVVGELRELVYATKPDPDGQWQAWHVENARKAAEREGTWVNTDDSRRFDGECSPNGETLTASIEGRRHPAGVTYSLPRGVFHQTIVDDCAVTVCTMRQKRGQARLLVPRGREPVHAFGGEPASQRVVLSVLREAFQKLERGE